jgi:predicted kinase
MPYVLGLLTTVITLLYLLDRMGVNLGGPQVIDAQLKGLADRNKDRFSRDQAESVVQMMIRVASADSELTEAQKLYIERIRSEFVPPADARGTWA